MVSVICSSPSQFPPSNCLLKIGPFRFAIGQFHKEIVRIRAKIDRFLGVFVRFRRTIGRFRPVPRIIGRSAIRKHCVYRTTIYAEFSRLRLQPPGTDSHAALFMTPSNFGEAYNCEAR